jgi:cell division inhibitor SulA
LVTPNHVVPVVDEMVVVVVRVRNPRHLVSASISVTTRSVSTEMNVVSSMGRMTNERKCKLVHNAKLLGNATNSVMKVAASSEMDVVSLTRKPAPLMMPRRMRMLKRR